MGYDLVQRRIDRLQHALILIVNQLRLVDGFPPSLLDVCERMILNEVDDLSDKESDKKQPFGMEA